MILEECNINTILGSISTDRTQTQKSQATTMSLLKKYHSIQIKFLFAVINMTIQVASSLAKNISIIYQILSYILPYLIIKKVSCEIEIILI